MNTRPYSFVFIFIYAYIYYYLMLWMDKAISVTSGPSTSSAQQMDGLLTLMERSTAAPAGT